MTLFTSEIVEATPSGGDIDTRFALFAVCAKLIVTRSSTPTTLLVRPRIRESAVMSFFATLTITNELNTITKPAVASDIVVEVPHFLHALPSNA